MPDLITMTVLDACRGVGLVPQFQPIVDLSLGKTVAYEALARWPSAPGMTPDKVFGAAKNAGLLDDLDLACRIAALEGAMQAGLGSSAWLFVNAEPTALGAAHLHSGASATVARAHRDLRLVLELTERALLRHPSDLLRHVALARAAGWRIALDDLGAHPDSVALLDLVMPDVIKLDLALIQNRPSRDQARTLAAVTAYSERNATIVLAEGVETPAHLDQARACGATLGQGHLFGSAGDLPGTAAHTARLRLPAASAATPATPFDLAIDHAALRTASKALLIALSRHIEAQADNPIDPPVVLTALQEVRQLPQGTLDRYIELGRTSPLVALLGRDVPDRPGGAVRGVALEADDPLVREWTVVALGAQTAVALIARDKGDDVADLDRRFDFLITYDRVLVGKAARSLMSRLN